MVLVAVGGARPPPAARPADPAHGPGRYINKTPRRNKFAVLTAFNNNLPILHGCRVGRNARTPLGNIGLLSPPALPDVDARVRRTLQERYCAALFTLTLYTCFYHQRHCFIIECSLLHTCMRYLFYTRRLCLFFHALSCSIYGARCHSASLRRATWILPLRDVEYPGGSIS